MTIFFTEEEKKWIDRKPFNWQVKDDCPKGIKKSLSKKLKLLHKAEKGEHYGIAGEKL